MLVVIAVSWQPSSYKLGFYNTTASAPKGFYQILREEPLARGQYVVITVPSVAASTIKDRGWGEPGTPLLKRVGAIPGDIVKIGDDGLYINQNYIGPVYKEDRQGRPMPKLRGTFVIQPGEFFPVSTYERSFDARYFGPVPIHSILYQVKPFVTFE